MKYGFGPKRQSGNALLLTLVLMAMMLLSGMGAIRTVVLQDNIVLSYGDL